MTLPEFSPYVRRRVCEAYGLSNSTDFVPLRVSENRTLKVIVAGRDQPQVIRLYRNSWKGTETLNAELSVLSYIQNNSGLLVPFPIANRDGALLTILKNEVSEEVRLAMFSYVGGQFITQATHSRVYELGETLAKLDRVLYQADSTLEPTPSSHRLVWNSEALIDWPLERLFEKREVYPFLNGTSKDSGKSLPPVQDIAERLKYHFGGIYESLPQQLLHADATFDNVKFGRRKVGILDFDEMGYGARIYELTAPLCSSLMLMASQPFASTLLEGYVAHVQLADLEFQSLPLFVAVRLFGSMGWAANRADVSWTRGLLQSGPARLEHILALLDAYEREEYPLKIEPAFYGIEPYGWPDPNRSV